ncbi:MAG: bifunctional phosphopantothenoylcysteine decarboxylase/phosphopantothenate--cysteine ligase CoaBC [Cytophagales bacterium]|jgi:phosphopantothenoylcysteine decarboxylase/phosphopantothenate--cysteine ligase|nr:bifunctional phosphopantothenoylcysteine decarboxylase/phosphopantothenate--cysteine ligase CoaBC [Cytophagales bacterium]MCA6389577.1 bifunctional phosphopantothenoylcysteine decarboxylase/phosphopantothenate--cysteine ligase CoaBC [Cytophagales bacterium]MCA6390623.1 bifunctional phosphopantothenoylcysteine decarboxylase/phosphopantothenate--cysteine ligase CoaBC [Cytophagales bacterium]MCA6396857.1 bifunctional phosphopantothenoylcysteine decarboxylase/phosphopantothenate--cysteine ligase 
MLAGKKIIVGVSGSIAAYKSALLVRLLAKEGVEVKVVMTSAAKDFITPLTLATLSKNPVLIDFTKDDQGGWNNHVELGLWADAMVIAPASANTLAKMANGSCDNLLSAVYLSARCPVFFAPAMDLDMLQHPSTKSNIDRLISFGNHQIMPAFGELASGLVGTGRMAEPEEIVDFLSHFFSVEKKLSGKKALVTAGPTHEALDPVRFIGNNSSGKMGFAIAEELANMGADVELVVGPTHLAVHSDKVKVTRVTSAEDMYNACVSHFPSSDIAVLSAAVADYRPIHKADQKIKKSESSMTIELTKTRDIAAELGTQKKANQYVVGFALETENETANAEKKIVSKNFDLIVLNSLNDKGAGFGQDTNKITLIDRAGSKMEFPLKSKEDVAKDIVNAIVGAIKQ